jgi:lipopolysaccharide exporter
MHDSDGRTPEEASDAARGSIPRKIARGALWVTITSICAKGATLISSVVLARLLDPTDFGLLALAAALITLSQGATQTGFESALIQKQNHPEDFLNAAWTFELLRCLILFAAIFVLAPVLGSAFDEPRAAAVLRAVSVTLVLQGLRNIGAVYFRKHFDFHKQFVLEIAPLALYVPLVILLAVLLKSVWALVWATLAANLLNCMLSYAMHRYRPRLDFSLKKAKNLFRFGKWILGNSILVMARDQGTTIFVGKFLGMPALGFLNRADAFSTALFQQVSDVAWKVGYPAYSHLHRSPREFKGAYLKTLHLLTLIGLPMAGGLFVLSTDFVHVVLTDKWLPIVPVIEVLCLLAAVNFISTPALVAFQASGRPAFVATVSFVGVIVLAAAIVPLASRFGITGAAWALCMSALIPSPFLWRASMKLIGCSFTEWLKPIGTSLISTCAMLIAIVLIKTHILLQVEMIGFFTLIGVGVCVYVPATLLIDRSAKQEIVGYIKATI